MRTKIQRWELEKRAMALRAEERSNSEIVRVLTTGDVADLINALETIRRELLADMISLRRQDTQ